VNQALKRFLWHHLTACPVTPVAVGKCKNHIMKLWSYVIVSALSVSRNTP